jgi:hypothetical protein
MVLLAVACGDRTTGGTTGAPALHAHEDPTPPGVTLDADSTRPFDAESVTAWGGCYGSRSLTLQEKATSDRPYLRIAVGFKEWDVVLERDEVLAIDPRTGDGGADGPSSARSSVVDLVVGASRRVMPPAGTHAERGSLGPGGPGGPGDAWQGASVEAPELARASVRFVGVSPRVSLHFDLVFADGSALRGAATEDRETASDCLR